MKNLLIALTSFFLLIQVSSFLGTLVKNSIDAERTQIENAQTTQIEAL